MLTATYQSIKDFINVYPTVAVIVGVAMVLSVIAIITVKRNK